MDKMTIYFSKSTGEIKRYCTGEQDMSFFGTDKDDYSIIWDFIVLDKDDYVIGNIDKFKIEDGKIKLKEVVDLSKYM